MKETIVLEQDAKSRLDKLYKEILFHNKKYFQDDNPEISDAEFDELVREAILLESEFPKLKKKNSPTEKVGYKP